MMQAAKLLLHWLQHSLSVVLLMVHNSSSTLQGCCMQTRKRLLGSAGTQSSLRKRCVLPLCCGCTDASSMLL
jgi:hypothetical protein